MQVTRYGIIPQLNDNLGMCLYILPAYRAVCHSALRGVVCTAWRSCRDRKQRRRDEYPSICLKPQSPPHRNRRTFPHGAICIPGNLDKRRGALLVSNSQADPKVSLGRYSDASDNRDKKDGSREGTDCRSWFQAINVPCLLRCFDDIGGIGERDLCRPTDGVSR